MKSFRSVIFWIHLAVGVTAGIVIFIMSVTGVALTYEKQMIEWADRNAWTAPASPRPRTWRRRRYSQKSLKQSPG